ncbi:MAG TPA: hypothetical protein HA298_01035 [Methanobacteriales archaeon]|nr:MAG: Uncharacterized protein XD44_0513 [Methanobacteriaceae archaeon 41_258]MBC7089576.1 hypothetical protein [Methanobacteriaceae archaeon]MBC7096116.1 hypothetical protein [Methanobacteriales archaeon]HIH61262.1 hypothetical protein [Methanobacteriales archaeon]
MDKKYWALIIVLVLVVGGYASYYAYAMTTLVPKDLKTFKDDLKAMEEPFITPSEIKEMEEIRSMLEGVDLKVIPAEERKKIADEIRSEIPLKELQEFKYNCSSNREDVAFRYDVLLMGDVAKDIREVYSKDVEEKAEKLITLMNKMADDFEKGDTEALKADIDEFIKLGKELENWRVKIGKPGLQRIVEKLGG